LSAINLLVRVTIILGITLISFPGISENTDKTKSHDNMHHGDMKYNEMKHGDMSYLHHGEHKPVDTAGWEATPSLTLTAHRDAMSGWNLFIGTTNFTFAPEHVNNPSRNGEGHAHLYINGNKIGRLYSNWYHIDNLSPGTHTVLVTLNANTHGHLLVNNEPIAASILLEQK